MTTYALVARGVTILDINSVSVSGEVVVEINNTGMAQDRLIAVSADQEVHVLFADGTDVQRWNASEVELRLINSIGRWVDDLGADLAARKATVPVIMMMARSRTSVLAEPIPGSTDTLVRSWESVICLRSVTIFSTICTRTCARMSRLRKTI